MKKFTEPSIEILRLEISDILTASGDWLGWNFYGNDSNGQTANGGWLQD